MRVSVAVVCGLCLVALVGGLTVGAEPAAGQTGDTSSNANNSSQTIEITLTEDGDANVDVSKRIALETEADRTAFDRLAEDFENGEVDGALSVEVFERLAAAGENETDREMAIEDVERDAESTASTGILRLSFTWEGFVDASGGEMEFGDSFVIDDETWLPSLSEDQRLVIRAPEGYAVKSVTPEAALDDGTVVWEGPQQFEPGQPTATLVAGDGTDGDLSVLTVGLGAGLVGAIVLLVLVLSRRGDDAPFATTDGGDRGWMPLLTPAPGPEEGTDRDAKSDPVSTPDPDPDPFAGVDEELLSDEERVIRLLEVNDGRMKQATIVIETDWSNAKVSQLLSLMEEDGEIEKLRIGRENLITLVEEE
ncbi:helix-turn-helix transcriptional regulator [Halalkalicoccus jeotgali]|uniref:HTH iclR-type domain-containing protein n=1 Tax=Halalkalicoccus jeotgali (strain DSM 18796 / CECT 7217 / JCM 14584 / KCTC 4019 / B3) TaxID=795797 RepID=D8J5W0_HALJB|nr:hypothetical protein [Halalkalicoccus jeotgali]ADJ13766.1 hypothetical protein HacjB3_01865 [Halalkalicoccus jeotgali B3]ELY34188.1 hypothetical protein C497_17452 [Halalkalicoccus jeotgali B3]